MRQKVGYIVFIFSLLVCVPLRTWQLFSAIDYSTGFYTPGHVSVPLLAAMLIGFCVVLLIFSLLAKAEDVHFSALSARQVPLGIVSIITGLAFILWSIMDFFAILAPAPLDYINLIFAVLCCTFFVLFGIALCRKRYLKVFVFLALAPVVWSLIRLIVAFIVHTNAENISEYLFETLMLCAILLFFMFSSKAIAGETSKRTASMLTFSSYMCALLCFVSAGSRFIYLAASPFPENGFTQPSFLDLFIGLWAFVFITSLIFSKQKAAGHHIARKYDEQDDVVVLNQENLNHIFSQNLNDLQ